MKKIAEILKKSQLFLDVEEDNIEKMLSCMGVKTRTYTKGTFILKANENATAVGIVLFGSVQIMTEDFWGNRSILTKLDPGDMFGEVFAGAGIHKIPVNVVASETSEIMFLDYSRMISTCSSACTYHTQIIRNMLKILAGKNMLLTQKMEHLVKRTTRDKLLSYLSEQALRAGSHSFVIPFNRQELADYLSVDRSAMSNELCKMRDAGILKFEKNYFEIQSKENN